MPKQSRTRNAKATIGTSSVRIAEECFQERTFISVINTSTGGQIISIGVGEEASPLAGIVLYPGGSWNENKSDSSDRITNEALNAISSAAGGTIAIRETILMEVI